MSSYSLAATMLTGVRDLFHPVLTDESRMPISDPPSERASHPYKRLDSSPDLKKIVSTHNPSRMLKKTVLIFNLPPELMDIVLSFLSPLSQICLALSCKRFYRQFKQIVKSSIFRFPYSRGLDRPVDLELPFQLLLRLQSQDGSSSTQQRTYCAACLKLHPRTEFDIPHFRFKYPRIRQCRLPRTFVLCPPHHWLSQRELLEIREYLHTRPHSNSKDPEISKHVLKWHECSYSSPAGEVSYALTISVCLSLRRTMLYLDSDT